MRPGCDDVASDHRRDGQGKVWQALRQNLREKGKEQQYDPSWLRQHSPEEDRNVAAEPQNTFGNDEPTLGQPLQ